MLIFGGVAYLDTTFLRLSEMNFKALLPFSKICGFASWTIAWEYDGIAMQLSGQIIATSHDLTPNGGLVREIPLFQGNLGW